MSSKTAHFAPGPSASNQPETPPLHPGEVQRQNVQQFLHEKPILPLIKLITAPLLFHRPENPSQYLLRQLQLLKEYKETDSEREVWSWRFVVV